MMDVQKFRTLLLDKRKLLESIDDTAQQGAQPVELDQTRVGRVSRVDALQLQAMSAEAIRRREIELGRIGSALARIESGDYGYCLSCGEDIAPGRLEVDPACTLCIRCASRLERG